MQETAAMTEGNRESKRPPDRSRRARPKKPGLAPDVQKQIGMQLRTLYTDVLQEGVPDRFTELLRRLDEKDSKEAES